VVVVVLIQFVVFVVDVPEIWQLQNLWREPNNGLKTKRENY